VVVVVVVVCVGGADLFQSFQRERERERERETCSFRVLFLTEHPDR